jgi:hypothetical protein
MFIQLSTLFAPSAHASPYVHVYSCILLQPPPPFCQTRLTFARSAAAFFLSLPAAPAHVTRFGIYFLKTWLFVRSPAAKVLQLPLASFLLRPTTTTSSLQGQRAVFVFSYHTSRSNSQMGDSGCCWEKGGRGGEEYNLHFSRRRACLHPAYLKPDHRLFLWQ